MALSEIVSLTLFRTILSRKKKNQDHFVWKHSRPKLQHKTLRLDYKEGVLKMLIYSSKLQAYSVQGLKGYTKNHFIESFSWITPLYFTESVLGKSFNFYSNLDFENSIKLLSFLLPQGFFKLEVSLFYITHCCFLDSEPVSVV